MRISGAFVLAIAGMMLVNHARPAAAVEEGQFVKKEGKWEYYSGEDPGLKYLYLKGIITQEEYDKGLRVIETKERLSRPNFSVDVNNGLNVRVGDRFLFKLRLLAQARYSYATYNSAWGTVGDSRNPEILGGQVEYRAVRYQSDSSNSRCRELGFNFSDTHGIRIFATTFLGRLIRRPGIKKAAAEERGFSMPTSPPGISHGRQFSSGNSASGSTARQISSIATSTFADNMRVQNAFAANLISNRDMGISILSDEDQISIQLCIGHLEWSRTKSRREGTSVSQAVLPRTSAGGPPRSRRRTYNYNTRF